MNERKPERHIDVGSRIDGFVAHVASFREIEVFDFQPLPLKAHPNIVFTQADLMNDAGTEITDSLSCLHALEHFGLGRYNDPIDVNGHIKGVANLVRMVKPGGVFYLGVPISDRDEVRFNSERAFHPESVVNFEPIKSHMTLQRFDYVDDADGGLVVNADIKSTVAKRIKGCGIYTFIKTA
ncbi:DUF268 domain-containing protein [Rhizobium sullae]|uniref:DUF268 domain-containing protein n=1 Tax=Rhizobium sullae TaxID=50338 RepID=A0ABY5XP52_RHISU|nr:DUF268 domain-containing protein [Rhizobium sullae]UWU16177.1 DUF268 domain-containing protein [Rhizobium sullae]